MSVETSIRSAVRAPAFKFVIVLVLILLLTIPLLFVYALIAERESNASRAEGDVGQAWGGPQVLSGPYLVVPTETDNEVQQGEAVRRETVRSFAVFLPERLETAVTVATEVRRRGIFDVPVYRSTAAVSGFFEPPDVQALGKSVDRVLWPEAVMVMLVADVRGIKKTAVATLSPGVTRQFRAGTGVASSQTPGIHVPLGEVEAQARLPFSFDLELNGSASYQFVPAGGETAVRITADWPHPSFSGNFLPEAHEITAAGFSARWDIPRLARGKGQVRHLADIGSLSQDMTFGVAFHQPIRFYSLAERALKYAMGFIAVAFFAVFVMEIQTGRRVHWIQYLFAGLALVVFYVLLIGTAEHIGFDAGYAGAATATSLLIGSYFGTVVRSWRRGTALCAILATIYGLLYLLLRIEDYALLVGSIAAFVLLAIVMFSTRNVDWSKESVEPEQAT